MDNIDFKQAAFKSHSSDGVLLSVKLKDVEKGYYLYGLVGKKDGKNYVVADNDKEFEVEATTNSNELMVVDLFIDGKYVEGLSMNASTKAVVFKGWKDYEKNKITRLKFKLPDISDPEGAYRSSSSSSYSSSSSNAGKGSVIEVRLRRGKIETGKNAVKIIVPASLKKVDKEQLTKKELKGAMNLAVAGGTEIDFKESTGNTVVSRVGSPIATVTIIPSSTFAIQIQGEGEAMNEYWRIVREAATGDENNEEDYEDEEGEGGKKPL